MSLSWHLIANPDRHKAKGAATEAQGRQRFPQGEGMILAKNKIKFEPKLLEPEYYEAQQTMWATVGCWWDYRQGRLCNTLLFFLQLWTITLLSNLLQPNHIKPNMAAYGHSISLCQSVTYVCMCARTRMHANMSATQSQCIVHTLALMCIPWHICISDIS